MSKPRFQVELTPQQNELLDQLIEDAELSGKRDLFNSALALFYWAVERSKEGRAIASVAPDGKSMRDLEMPVLMTVREAARRRMREQGEMEEVWIKGSA